MTKFALIAVAVLVAVSVGVMKPAEAQSAPTTAELQEQADLLDRLLLITYHTWVFRYNANRTNDDFEHFDWSQDHCSVPFDLQLPYRELFRMSCLRHDFMWRTLAVIDEGTGRMWNERNRYRADRQIESDTQAACLTEYPNGYQQPLLRFCRNASSTAYNGIRDFAGYRGTLVGDEEPSVDNRLIKGYRSGIKVMPRQDCSHARNESNRCLPIYYVRHNGNPISPQNISDDTGRFPVYSAIELEVVRANLQSVNGPPNPSVPLLALFRGYTATADLMVETLSPFVVGTKRDLSCTNQSSKRRVHAGAAEYSPTDEDAKLKTSTIYVMACSSTTTSQFTVDKMRLRTREARRVVADEWQTRTGGEVRGYPHMKAASAGATLIPRPDDYNFSNEDQWYRFRVNTNSPFTRVKLVANPNDDTPLLELTDITSPNNHCADGAGESDTISIADDGYARLAMCDGGTSTLELRDPDTNALLNNYVIGHTSIPSPRCNTVSTLLLTSNRTGQWDSGDCVHTFRDDRYVDWYRITVSGGTTFRIDLVGTDADAADTYLVVYEGTLTAGEPDYEDDDAGTGNNSYLSITPQRTTTFTIGASTFVHRKTGGYRLTISEPPECDFDVTNLSSTYQGSFESECDAQHRDGAYAQFVTFTLSSRRAVTIDLRSSTDTYLFLLEGRGRTGRVITSNDNSNGPRNSQIVRILTPGTYTVEATTYAEDATGSFTLNWTLRNPEPPPTPTGLRGVACGQECVDLSWDEEDGVSRYKVQYHTGQHWVNLTDYEQMERQRVSNLDCGTSYLFRIGAYGNGQRYESSWSGYAETNASTQACTTSTPSFGSASYAFTVLDSAGNGHTIGTVSATDPDTPASQLRYSITGGNQAGKFAINSTNGRITVAGSLDYDTTASYTLTVTVTDGDSQTDTATVIIAVTEVVATATDACIESLGTLTAPVTKTGAWASDCGSEARTGRYAEYYSFTLAGSKQVEMNLTSGVDPYLVLRQGEGRNGTIEASNDNVSSRNSNSSINRVLSAGTYTVEATTYFSGQAGSFTLSVRPLQRTENLGALTRSVDRSNSVWVSNYASTQHGRGYARSYTFTLAAATHVVINLTSSEDPYLYVLRNGTVVHENDNVSTRNLNSRIDEKEKEICSRPTASEPLCCAG